MSAVLAIRPANWRACVSVGLELQKPGPGSAPGAPRPKLTTIFLNSGHPHKPTRPKQEPKDLAGARAPGYLERRETGPEARGLRQAAYISNRPGHQTRDLGVPTRPRLGGALAVVDPAVVALAAVALAVVALAVVALTAVALAVRIAVLFVQGPLELKQQGFGRSAREKRR